MSSSAKPAGYREWSPLSLNKRNVVAHANEEVVLDAGRSYDPDGVIVTYTWKRLPDNVVLYSGPEPTFTHVLLGAFRKLSN